MDHKKGSILFVMMVLIMVGTLLVGSHRLFRSHLYLERGIYSLDLRVSFS